VERGDAILPEDPKEGGVAVDVPPDVLIVVAVFVLVLVLVLMFVFVDVLLETDVEIGGCGNVDIEEDAPKPCCILTLLLCEWDSGFCIFSSP
jgi:hypothetical protein